LIMGRSILRVLSEMFIPFLTFDIPFMLNNPTIRNVNFHYQMVHCKTSITKLWGWKRLSINFLNQAFWFKDDFEQWSIRRLFVVGVFWVVLVFTHQFVINDKWFYPNNLQVNVSKKIIINKLLAGIDNL
jgi:hypothetical protein